MSIEKRLKRVLVVLLGLILINPIILYLISGSLLTSIILPLLCTLLFAFLKEKENLNPIAILVFNLMVVISFFIHAEAIFTYQFSDHIIEDLYEVRGKYYFNRPYLEKTFQDKEFRVQYKTNKQGFRIGAEDNPEIEVTKVDWLFIGDSYTQGAQVQYEELFTSQLFEHFPNKIIINAGISGLGIVDEYYYYIGEGSKLKPKKVFLQICNFNDFMNVNQRDFGFSDYLMQNSNFVRYILYGFKYANPAELPLGRWTEPFYPDERSNRDYNVFYKEQSKKKSKDLENFEHFLKKFAEAVKDNGSELIIIQIPTKEQLFFKYLNEVITSFNIDPSELDLTFPNRFLAKLCEKYRIEHIDLFDVFTNAEVNPFFEYDEHLNTLGHALVAKTIADFEPEKPCGFKKPHLLSAANAGDRYPVFANSDQNLIAFQSYRDGNMELFLSDSLFQDIRRLTWNNIDEIHPWVSSKGNQIVFTEGDQSTFQTKIAIMNIDGTERLYITNAKNTFGAIPSFNKENNKIAYAEWTQDNDQHLSNPYIVVYDLAMDKKHYITSDQYESWRPIFSADGQKLYFISKEENAQFDIFEYSFLDGTKRNVTNSIYEEWDPAISNDGKKLAYAAKQDDNWDLYLIDLSTNESVRLTRTLGNEWDPAFAPDGGHLYFSGTFGFRNGIFRIPIE